jgi:hypothetical protein
MVSLSDLQRDFLAALREGNPRVLTQLAADRRVPSETGLAIYVNAYGARLREALDNDHAQLGRYLGDELWDQLCAGYIAAHPSRYRSLRQFGDHLPDYLRATEPFAAQPQIAELAAFERRLLDSFDAADAPHADWSGLQSLPGNAWPPLRLRFHPSLQQLTAAWNSVEIWQALKDERIPPAAAPATSRQWALWRDAGRVTRFRSLDDEETLALEHFIVGGDFAGLCEALLDRHDPRAVPAQALQHLRRWADEGWIAHWASEDRIGHRRIGPLPSPA